MIDCRHCQTEIELDGAVWRDADDGNLGCPVSQAGHSPSTCERCADPTDAVLCPACSRHNDDRVTL